MSMKRALEISIPLQDLGHQVSIILEDSDENIEYANKNLGPINKLFFLKNKSATVERNIKKSLILNLDPDVVIVSGLGFRNLVRNPLKKSINIIDHIELESSISNTRISTKLKMFLLELFSVYYYDKLIVASKYLKKYFESINFQGKKILYLPFGCKNNNILNAPKINNFKTILYFGSLYENYGIHEIIKMGALIKKDHLPAKFIIAGKGPLAMYLKDVIKKEKLQEQITFLGFVDENTLTQLIYSSDAFILPMLNTRQDQARCPSKLPMYMQAKRPIITAKVGEVFEYLGDDGFYYNIGSLDSMLKAIKKATDVDIKWKPKYLIENYTWKKLAEDLNEFIVVGSSY
jgi:glycosyltransferase involved in cell wall biosynthesis